MSCWEPRFADTQPLPFGLDCTTLCASFSFPMLHFQQDLKERHSSTASQLWKVRTNQYRLLRW